MIDEAAGSNESAALLVCDMESGESMVESAIG